MIENKQSGFTQGECYYWSPRRSVLGHVLFDAFLNDLEKMCSEVTKGCV